MPFEELQRIDASRRAKLRADFDQLLAAAPDWLTLEIGCGHGHFLTAYAGAHPEAFCVGVDVIANRLRRSNRKRDHAGLNLLCFIRAEAMVFLEELPPRFSLGRVFVLFPDPWPKRRHHKNRLIQPEFLSLLAQRALPGADLCLRTDHRPYFEEARAALAAHANWELGEQPWPFEHTTVFQAKAPSFDSCVATRKPPD